jgi:hypothetical protein
MQDFDKENTDFKNNISDLFYKYKNNPYILQRLQTHLTNLPVMLETENKRYEERVSRINELTLEQDNFYKVFLSKHQYYYMPYNNIFYEYDAKTYKIIKEDDIHHHLLSTITDEGKLMVWKHKTKQNIIKQIKERTLFKSVPETYTIQNVLGFLNTIFDTKTEAKYFLTVIGDCILRKNNHTEMNSGLLFFVNSNMKKFITYIDSIAYVTTGNSILNNFISKYHDTHNLLTYRLIKTNDHFNSIATDLIKDVLNKIGIDLLCVAAHYSDRYTNSDNFIMNKEDLIQSYSMFFLSNTTNKIVDDFVSQCIEQVTTNPNNPNNPNNIYNLSWKNMHYIWKQYLSSINVPNMIYSNTLKALLKERLAFTENTTICVVGSSLTDIIFPNVTSKFLPSVSHFLSFWEKHITITTDANEEICDDEYEIDEIASLYKLTNKGLANLTDKEIIKMIWHYFYPQVEVIDNKYVTNIRCNLWSKHDDINEMLASYRLQKQNLTNANANANANTLISFDDLYKNYTSYIQAKMLVEKSFHLIVSKHFFEKWVTQYLGEYIKFDKFVSSDWLTTA